MKEQIDCFVANNNKLRILSRINTVRLASSIQIDGWESIYAKATTLLKDAGIEIVSKEDFLDGYGDAMLLFKWGEMEKETAIAQLQAHMDMQIPGTEEQHISIVWLSESLCVLEMQNTDQVEAILLTEIKEFAAAQRKACSLPIRS